ncbi:superoxide dismutase [Cu-Zn] [Pholiota conissans]|uniref:Superoxide dismutase [Cu-Zn] n=1 Tax=Pholiota conissans TaxID=109636 RepID=A0A9P6CVH5_9AGAR|nr:superoxide dismutase [Cu-Zn] [Pholiota conissans]
MKAVAILQGNYQVSGKVVFEQNAPGKLVTITGNLTGLPPNNTRGFHIHTSGDLTGGCSTAGAHYNPFHRFHGAPEDFVRHVGDLGNIKSDASGNSNFVMTDKVISLNGFTSIIGRTVVVHTFFDDLGRAWDGEETTETGNSGSRAACGIIGIA